MRNRNREVRARCPLVEQYTSFRQTCWTVFTESGREGFHLPEGERDGLQKGVAVGLLLLVVALLWVATLYQMGSMP